MGLDSVELVMGWEEAFGIDIPDAAVERMQTVRDASEWIAARVGAWPLGPCRTRRAFHRLRRVLGGELGVPRGAVRPDTRIVELLSATHLPPARWNALREQLGPGWMISRGDGGEGFLAKLEGWSRDSAWRARRGKETAGDVARDLAAHDADLRPAAGHPWSREAVALMVRRVTIDEIGVYGFSDHAAFVEDLGVD